MRAWWEELEERWPEASKVHEQLVVSISWFPVTDPICFALGNKSGSFCEAVNCERSEREGKFLFAILWFPFAGFI